MELPGLFYRGEFIVFIVLYIVWRFSRYRLKISKISNRHVFITGCDSGFGRLLAERLLKAGVRVYAGCLLPSSVEEITQKYGSLMTPVMIDVTKTESVKKARDYVRDQLNGKALWAVVNNAGIAGINLPFEWTTKEDCQKTLDVNLLGVYDVTLAFLPLIKRGKEGRIVNVASIFGRVGHLLSGYTMSKYGIEAFSDGLSIAYTCYMRKKQLPDEFILSKATYETLQSLRVPEAVHGYPGNNASCHQITSVELDPYNITVHTLEPGYFSTPLVPDESAFGAVAKARWSKLDPEIRRMHGEDFVEKIIRFFDVYMKRVNSPKVNLVVDAYEHAVLAKFPDNRYPVGNDMKFLYVPMSWLPFPYQFRIMKLLQRFTGIQKPIPDDAVKHAT